MCIDSEFSVYEKVICSSFNGSSGYKASSGNSGSGVHATAVVATSALGLVPPFFIFAGKNDMENWTSVVSDEIGNLLKVTPFERFTRKGWFRDDGVILCNEHGSMTSYLLPVFIRHLNTKIRNIVSEDEHVLVTFDGHSSRKGLAWPQESGHSKMIVVRSPANTTHVFQPCAQRLNKRISKEVRRTRDSLIEAGMINTKAVQFKLMCAIAAISSVSEQDVRASFTVMGMWPSHCRFVNLSNDKGRSTDETAVGYAGVRRSDADVVRERLNVLADETIHPSVRTQKVLKLLTEQRTTAAIMEELMQSIVSGDN